MPEGGPGQGCLLCFLQMLLFIRLPDVACRVVLLGGVWCFLVERGGVCCAALRGDVLRRVVFNPLKIKLFLIIAAPKTGQRLSGWCCESEIYALRDRIWHRSDCCENSLASFKMYSIPEAEGFDELRIGGEFVSWP